MKIRLFHKVILLLALTLPVLALAQTTLPTNHHSYVMPGDSLWIEQTLSEGDVLTWSLWLSRAGSGGMTLTLRSADEGELWRRSYGGEPQSAREDVKITRASRYRLTLKSESPTGRAADLNAWSRYGKSDRIPFPIPEAKRFAESFRAGDHFSVDFEFKLPDTTRFQSLLALDLPRTMALMWASTAFGDSIPATATVSRWYGETGRLTLRERAPQGGSITLKLTLDLPFDGDATVFVAPGDAPPAWLPKSARMGVTHANDPWSVVAVPPRSADTTALVPRAKYAALSLRSRGVDAATVDYISVALTERDSLLALRRGRQSAGYDTTFYRSARAFIAPVLHYALTAPLAGLAGHVNAPKAQRMTWFVEGVSGTPGQGTLYEWRYDEARFALPAAPDEILWDNNLLPLTPQHQTYPAAGAQQPATITFALQDAQRPLSFERNGLTLTDQSRRVWGFYLDNPTADTLYLVLHEQQVVERPDMVRGKWPKVARVLIGILAVLALAGGAAFVVLRRRELARSKMAQELAADLEKARQTQLKLLPQSPFENAGLELIGLHQSMQSVGGDYYDFFALEDGRVLLCVADVTGHGYKAALIMSNLQATLRAVAPSGKSLTDIVSMLNIEVYRRTNPEDFVTLIIGVISADRKSITVCNAGHNPGYIVKPSGAIQEMLDGGLMLGALEFFPFSEKQYALGEGDVIAFYTDGIPEATIGKDGEMYGYERLKVFLAERRYSKPREIAQALLRQVAPSERAAIEDDMAVVIARVGN